MNVELVLNGERISDEVAPELLLVEYVREQRRLTGTKIGCDTSVCGACTVLVDGSPVKSCTMLAVQAARSEVTTIEGLASGETFSLVSEAMHAEHGVQCGFCTPGLVATMVSLFARKDEPSEETVLSALDGHLCRCTGYVGIRRAVRRVVSVRAGRSPTPMAGTSVGDPLARHDVEFGAVAGADVEVV